MDAEAASQWRFAQCFGDKGEVEDITEADIISTVEFDHTGDYLATGDKGGRVVLFERNEQKRGYKTIKLWKVFDKQIKVVAENNHSDGYPGGGNGALQPPLRLPRMTTHDSITAAVPRKVYANAHAYHINSISVNSDGETYISADDLRINLWNLNISDQSFMFEEEEDPTQKSFFSEIISSISDVKFSRDGQYILSRDYLTLKIWDIKMENKPVKTINIHDHLRQKLCDLYENDCIFDKFECTFSGDGSQVLTGSYHNYFRIYDVNGDNDVVLQADKSAFKAKKIGGARGKAPGKKEGLQTEGIDFAKKILAPEGEYHRYRGHKQPVRPVLQYPR
ncbi:serine/threonine-protein phosphatase 2A regulatory subunit B beta isoform [Kwoniella newhampshirensis]|uniref:Protein phosphatase PP2A regulatory subunit B n=1 Tax=Kwoniella newhampshirensis TaxID=1651941 RepID=A0AAW0YTA9_9TREE